MLLLALWGYLFSQDSVAAAVAGFLTGCASYAIYTNRRLAEKQRAAERAKKLWPFPSDCHRKE